MPTARILGSFTTAPLPELWQDVRFAIMSCQGYKDQDDPGGFLIYPAMHKSGASFYVATGDNVYYDNDPPLAKTVAMARYHWNRMFSLPLLVDFHRQMPGYWEKDDHDTVKNDSWPPQGKNADRSDTLEGKLTFFKGLKIFREQVPMGEKTYRTFRWGKGLQIWLTEGRDFRSPNNMPDGPEKTIWGREQLEWLKSSLLASDADVQGADQPDADRRPRPRQQGRQSFKRDVRPGGQRFPKVGAGQQAHRQLLYLLRRPALAVPLGRSGDRPERVLPAGAASDKHAGGSPGLDPEFHKFHRVKGGFLTISVSRPAEVPTIAFRHHDVEGEVVYEFVLPR